MKATIRINCCLCPDGTENEIEVEDGWALRYDEIYEDNGFCPDHVAVTPFTHTQCPGCVGGWGDCAMWKAFAYSYNRDITEDDFAALEKGICPRRTNGTLAFDTRKRPLSIEDIDLSERAPTEAGKAFADAIREYMDRYPSKDGTPD